MAGRGTGNLTGVIVCDNWTSINVTVDTTLITGTASQHIYICAIQMMAAGAVNAAIVSGTGTTCQTGTGAVFGGTTAATGWNFPANGGIAHGSGLGVVGRTAAVTDGICIDVSAAVQVSGNISWTKF
jgi:hypothetical protein